MGNKIAGHILSETFYKDTKVLLGRLAKSALLYNNITQGVDTLLETHMTVSPRGHVIMSANPTQPQSVYETAHDELLNVIDNRAFHLAHLIKINNFLPHLINRFTEEFLYSETVEEGVSEPDQGVWEDNVYCRYNFEQASQARQNPFCETEFTVNIHLNNYMDLDAISEDMGTILENGYSRLNLLRLFMSPDTLQRRQNNTSRDIFCTKFLEGKETTAEDFRSRTEFHYFQQMKVNLGVFDTSPNVAKWLAEARRKPSNYEHAIACLKDKNRGLMLPAVMLKDASDAAIDLRVIKRQLAREFKGPIPKEGIFLGHATKPPSGKPQLVL